MEYLEAIKGFVTEEVLETIVLLVVLAAGRFIALRYVRRRTKDDIRSQRQWVSTVRNTALVLLLLGLLFIWSPQLSSLALSLTAVALAIVIATKEIILNVSAALMNMVTDPFEVGDWIEVDGIRGEVVSENLFAVKLAELDEDAGLTRFTGRTLTVPNAKFLTSTVIDEGEFRQFMFHRFRVHVDPASGVFDRRDEIDAIADRHTQAFREQGERVLAMAQRKSQVDLPGGAPLVRIRTAENGNTAIEFTIFCTTDGAIEAEQAIARDVMALLSPAASGAVEVPGEVATVPGGGAA